MRKTIYFFYKTARLFSVSKTKGPYCLSIAVTCFILFASLTSSGQMVSAGDVFLRGAHLEAGIGKYGNFGSDVAAPAGYHPHFTGGNYLSIVADPDATGWDTSTASHYWGDFFLPGYPFEGWTLQVDTMRCMGSNSGTLSPTSFTLSAGMPPCSIVDVAYSTSGTTVSGKWQGLIDSVMLTQVATLDTTTLYITVDVTLTNLSVLPKDNIYYYRAADPDNDATWPGGSPVTENTIVYQAPDTLNASVVSATGHLAGSSYIALGSGDSASRAVVVSTLFLPITQDLGAVYNTFTGAALYAQGDSNYADDGIGVIIKVAHLASVDSAIDSVLRTTATYAMHPANTANFKFFYAFSPSALSAAIAATRPDTAVTPVVVDTATGIKNVTSSPGIRVYPNPAGSTINITGLNASDRVALYDMMGRIVNQASAATTGVNTLYVNNIPAGAYILEVNDASGNAKARVPVMKQ